VETQKPLNFRVFLTKALNERALSVDQLRSFACACARRVLYLCPTSFWRQTLEFAERRALGIVPQDEVEATRRIFASLPESEEPEDDANPSASYMASGAVSEAAFTENPVTCAVNAASAAADAVGIGAGEKVHPDDFDKFYMPANTAERIAQSELFRQMFPNVPATDIE